MLSLSQSLRVFVCTRPTDMRRSFDGLYATAEQLMKQNPLSGHLFVFRNRNRDRLKVLYWDRDGLAIWYKRLEKGTFQLPTDLQWNDEERTSAEITVDELALLLGGVDLASVKRRKRFQPPNRPR